MSDVNERYENEHVAFIMAADDFSKDPSFAPDWETYRDLVEAAKALAVQPLPQGDEAVWDRIERVLWGVRDGSVTPESAKQYIRAALVRSKLPDEMSLCSHAGTCEQNAVEFDGAFCATPPIGDDARERVARAIEDDRSQRHYGIPGDWDRLSEYQRSERLHEADAAIAAIGSQSS